jgi:hypothetical protein
MLISHLHKFIYLKTLKTAGSSVELGLLPHLGKEDLAAPTEEHKGQNDKYNFDQHQNPQSIISKIGQKIWDEYDIIANIRNPWDETVSFFHFAHSEYEPPIYAPIKKAPAGQVLNMGLSYRNPFDGVQNLIDTSNYDDECGSCFETIKDFFEDWMNADRLLRNNDTYLFYDNGKFIPDIVIRYENLQEDYNSVCDKFNIPRNILPKTKTKSRDKFKHINYKKYYTENSKNLVQKYNKQLIDYCGYKF